MKKLSFLLSIVFALDSFFIGVFPNKRIVITESDNCRDYYIDGESENGLLRFGVAGEGNLFEPDEKITAIIECRDSSLYGTRAKISVNSEQAEFNKKGYVIFNSEHPFYTFDFSSEKNGIFDVAIKLTSGDEYSYKIGVLPRNKKASNDFYYGIQPYTMRCYTWGVGHWIPNYGSEESIDKILDTAEYLGINLVREDFYGWHSMQAEAGAKVEFKAQDFLVNKVTERGMKYNWILGNNAGLWSLNKKYLSDYDASRLWACAPDEELWEDFVSQLAEHYAGNTGILWEIWNEPNWEFFSGTQEEYFTLLENTAKILKAADKNAYVYSGGLALAEREIYAPYYKKAAELIEKGLLDNFGYHNHNGLSSLYDNMAQMKKLGEGAGLEVFGINSESGIPNADPATIACKALYTRSVGADGYVSFSFRKSVIPDGDVNDFAFFNEYLQPSAAVLSFGSVIRFLGDAKFISNNSNEKNLIIDEYNKDGRKILVYYSLGKNTKVKAPAGEYDVYDMYGNPITINRKIKVTNEPIYLIFG